MHEQISFSTKLSYALIKIKIVKHKFSQVSPKFHLVV